MSFAKVDSTIYGEATTMAKDIEFDERLRRDEFNPWWPPTQYLISYKFPRHPNVVGCLDNHGSREKTTTMANLTLKDHRNENLVNYIRENTLKDIRTPNRQTMNLKKM